jgi:light-independent protochlorophyllide reductase subunit L
MARRSVAIYGKGGIGKSTTTQNTVAALAEMGKKIMVVGCDPKADSTRLLLGGLIQKTVLDTLRDEGDEVVLEDVLMPGYGGTKCTESGGPEPGVGCAGRGIITAINLLEQLGAYEGDLDYVFYDVLGDVVCGGFASPLQHAGRALVVAANDFDSIFAMNRIVAAIQAKARNYEVRMGGVIANRSDSTDQIEKFNARTGMKTLAHFPSLDVIRQSRLKKSTLFEMDPTPEIVAVQNEYLRLAANLLAGTEALDARSLKDRDIFDLLGFD